MKICIIQISPLKYQIIKYIYIYIKSSLNYFPSTRWHKDKDKGEYGPAILTFWKNKNKWGEVRRCGSKDKYRGIDQSVDCSDGTIWVEGDGTNCCHLMYNTMYDNYWVDNTLYSIAEGKTNECPLAWIMPTHQRLFNKSIGPQNFFFFFFCHNLATILLWKRLCVLDFFKHQCTAH